jgi:hypothetical protein
MTTPSLAAVLIVRDEADVLHDCLASVSGVVDQIVVHDTGSLDTTIDIARQFGATLSAGPWTGDFAAARNAALAGCRCDWVVSIDADERLDVHGDLRTALVDTSADVFNVEVHNLHHAMPYVHLAPRVLRAGAVRWSGRVHEQPVRLDGAPPLVDALAPAVASLRHLGYADVDRQTTKSRRNADIAASELASLESGPRSDGAQISYAALDLARSLMSAGDIEAGVAALERVRRQWPTTVAARSATDALARHHLAVGADVVVLGLAQELRVQGADPSYCDWLTAQALAQLGRFDEAWELLHPIDIVIDTDGRRYPQEHVARMRSLLHEVIHAQRLAG